MNTQAKITEKTILLNIADRLVEAQRELDELTLQLALGKVEASEKFEEIKKQFRVRLGHLKKSLAVQKIENLTEEISIKLKELENELNSGKVEDKEMFTAQKKLIMKSLIVFEHEIKNRLAGNEEVRHFTREIENFKLKMEILRMKFELKRFAVKDDIKSNVDALRRQISKWIDKAREKVTAGENKIAGMKHDVKQAFHKPENSFI